MKPDTRPLPRLASALLLALAATATARADAPFNLIQTGGTFRADATNFAATATPFAYDAYGDVSEYGGVHAIADLNDGLYGNANSWLGGPMFDYFSPSDLHVSVGLIFSAPSDIYSFAFGRDNTGAFTDRANSFFIVQYSTTPLAGFDPLTATWQTIGTLDYASAPPPDQARRHLYEISPITGATAFRIITETEGSYESGFDEETGDPIFTQVLGQAIDELEIYGAAAPIPEPASVAALAGLATLALAATRRRRA